MANPQASVDKLTFARESLADVWAELRPLLEENNAESGAFEQLEVSKERYEMLERSRHLQLFTLRHGQKLVGYATFFISNHLHYQQKTMALQDVVFVTKPYRGRPVLNFISYCDRELEAMGVNAILRHSGMNNRLGRLLIKLGYQPQELTYMRNL